ncbi:MAG: ribose-5-phosphate isomerase RpiA [Alphaproteobacteria bacterium]
MSAPEASLDGIARRALDWVRPGEVLGLGTGRAATSFVRMLGERVREGLDVRGVPTSEVTAALARELGIPLLDLAAAGEIATTFDGADEVDPGLDLIKGYGGALVREKIVAASSRRRVMLVGSEKMVDALGAHGKLPVEIVPFALPLCRRGIERMGLGAPLRGGDANPWRTDNGNWILDVAVGRIEDPAGLDRRLREIPGVVGTGIFAGMADVVLVQRGHEVQVLERKGPGSPG